MEQLDGEDGVQAHLSSPSRTPTHFALAVLGAWHAVFVVTGALNGDEGAYLNDARLVARGALPYRDFGLTQMPLLPYVHAGPQWLFGPSLFVGRITSAVLAIAGVLVAVNVARRLGGERAATITALAYATFTTGIYHLSITKTYAPVTFVLLCALAVLVSPRPPEQRLPVGVLLVGVAFLLRFSAVAVFAPVVTLGVATHAARRRTVLAAVAVMLAGAAFVAADPASAWWGLFRHHVGKWDEGIASLIRDVAIVRVPSLLATIGVPALVVVAVAVRHRARLPVTVDDRRVELAVFAGGVLAFAGVHVVTGQWYAEHLVPAVAATIPLAGVAVATVLHGIGGAKRVAMLAVLSVYGVATTLVGIGSIDVSDGRTSVAEASSVGAFVAVHTPPGQRVFALRGLWAAMQADRDVLRGLEVAQFGVVAQHELDDLPLITPQGIVDALRARTAHTLVLMTGDDYPVWRSSGGSRRVLAAYRSAIEDGYVRIGRFPGAGQAADGGVEVYVRRSNSI